MTHLPFYSDIVDKNGSFKNIGAVEPGYLAEALVAKCLAGYGGIYSTQECKIDFFSRRIQREITSIIDHDIIKDASYSAFLSQIYINGLPECVSREFICSARDFMLAQPEFMKMLERAREDSRDLKAQWRISGAAALTALMSGAMYFPTLRTFAWWQDAILAGVAGAGVFIPIQARDRQAETLYELKRAAERLIIHQWCSAANESTYKITFENDIGELSINSIRLERNSREKIADFMDNTIRRESGNPAGILSIRITSDHPDLCGACLVLKPRVTPGVPANG